MKRIIAILAVAALILALGACTQKENGASGTDAAATEPVPETLAQIETTADTKALVAYFTAGIDGIDDAAHEIADATGGTEFEIKTEESYEEETGLLQQEINENIHPAITDRVDGMGGYNVVFIGFPAVDGQLPMAVVSFMEEYDLRDKIIIPFVYSADTDLSDVTRKIDSVTFGSSQALMLTFDSATDKNGITTWLTGLGF